MKHCFLNKNFTIAFPEMRYKNLFYLEKNELKGLMGDYVNKYLELYRPKNLCHVMLVDSFGKRLKNNTYTGALKLLKTGKLDLYAKPEALYLNEDFISFSTSVMSERFLIGQIGLDLSQFSRKQNFFSIFDFDFYIKFYAALVFLLTFVVMMKFLKLKPLVQKLCVILEVMFNLRPISMGYGTIAIIILLYNIYFMVYTSIITNNIKTSAIIVNTSEILDSKENVLKSHKTICWMENENELEMARQAAPETFLNKAYRKRGYNYLNGGGQSLCIFEKNPKMVPVGSVMNRIIFLLSELLMSATFAIISNFMVKEVYWISDESIFEMIMVFYFRKTLRTSHKFHFLTSQEFECALQSNLNKKLASKMFSQFEYKSRVYRRKKEVIDDFVDFDDLSLSYFEDFFYYAFLFYLVLIFTYIIYYCCCLSKRR